MPTLIKIDSFQHQVLRVLDQGAVATDWYSQINDTGTTAPSHGGGNITFDTSVKRTADHTCSLKLAFLAARSIHVRNTVPTGNRDLNASFYFRSDTSTNPSASTTQLFGFGFTANAVIGINTSGQITAKFGTGTTQTGSTDVCDGEWHRIDTRCVTSGSTGTLDVQVDGNALTQATTGITAADLLDVFFGFAGGGTTDYTVYVSDLIVSATSGDYPMGDHICLLTAIDAKGTHSLGSGAFQDEGGSTTDDFETSVDDAWNGTTPELSQTGEDYVQQTANDGAAYVEFTCADVTTSGLWGAQLGVLMAGEDSTTACNGETRVVDSGGTTRATTGLIDPSGSATIYNGYRVPFTSVPGGGAWSDSVLNACKIRFGFSTDAAPDVAMNAAIIEYAATWTAGTTITGVALTVTASLPTGTLTHTLTGVALSATPSLPTGSISAGGVEVTGLVLQISPTLPAGSLRHTLSGVVLTATPSLPTGKLDHKLTGVVLTATPSLPTGSLQHRITGTVLTVTPSLPTGSLTHTITGTVLTATPTLPTGQVTVPGPQTVTGVVLTVTPSLPAGTLTHTLTGVVVTATPTLPTGSLRHSITGVVLTVTPTLPTGSLHHTITGVALTVTPTLPVGQVTIPGTQTVTGVVLQITPTLPVGSLRHSITGVALTATPTLPAGTLNHSVRGVVITITPTLPTGTVTRSITGVTLTATPTLPIGTVGVFKLLGVAVQITPTLPTGLVTTVALGTLVKGPTRKVVLEGPNEASELVGAPSAVHIGAGRNSSEEL